MGNRPLEDNWRWSKKTLTNVVQNDATAEATTEKATSTLTAEYYINQIPKEQVKLIV